jgi:uroporphyrinogen-III synthase
LRLRSDKAGPLLAEALRETGAEVEDVVLYGNTPMTHDSLPQFDAVFFASSSAVHSFIRQWGLQPLEDKTLCVIGKPTFQTLEKEGIRSSIIAHEATTKDAIETLAKYFQPTSSAHT